jgi:uncharacterized protein YbaA (DUF1428 family)
MYVEGFVVAVPKENKSLYLTQAKNVGEKFKQWGANRIVECWQQDVPHGKSTDFYGAVKAKEDEEVIFSWIEYPSKIIRDEVFKRMQEDPEMKDMGKNMPFDGSRMIFGGFESILDIH